MPPPLTPLQSSLRFVRLIHGIFFLTMLLYPAFGERLQQGFIMSLSSPLFIAVAVVAAAALAGAVLARLKTVQPALQSLPANPNDLASLSRWKRGAILIRILLEMIVLLGAGLRIMGASFFHVLPFYIIPIALMLLWWPRQIALAA
ncbi:MAG: hypothetical protein WBZ32_06395 [Candidatus Acidiferrales bacterium]